jgi:hypothetical protein
LANCGWLWNDSSYLGTNDGGAWLLNDSSCAAEPGTDAGSGSSAGGGAGGYAKSWRDHWEAERKLAIRRAYLLDQIRSSDGYRRLKRKLAMLHEHLLDATWVNRDRIEERIAEIEEQIEMMERL